MTCREVVSVKVNLYCEDEEQENGSFNKINIFTRPIALRNTIFNYFTMESIHTQYLKIHILLRTPLRVFTDGPTVSSLVRSVLLMVLGEGE